MGLWLLSFSGRCNAAIVRAESLIQARQLAVADGMAALPISMRALRSIQFALGRLVGHQLSGDEAADLLTLLMIGSKREPVALAD
jgi:hypothetical protein